MQRLIFILFTFLTFSFNNKKDGKEQIIFDRIEFIFNLKQTIQKDVWESFTDKQFDVPLIYFTDTSSYVVNPTDKFLTTFKSKLVFENRQIKIYKTEQRVDSLPFHMETRFTSGTPTDEYYYHSPFMRCSSYEEVFKKIPEVLSTEEWVTMIMHEYFHGFQFKHPAYMDYNEKNIAQVQPDSLINIYNNNSWFKNLIDKENETLLKALSEPDNAKTEQLIDTFFKIRNQRRIETKQRVKLDIANYEKCFETMEGTARYVEFSLYNKFSTMPPDYKLSKSDTSFKSFKKFRNYKIENDKWLYLTEKSAGYFYAVGFNMAKLLDKQKIEYRTKLFNEGGLSLEDILINRKNGS